MLKLACQYMKYYKSQTFAIFASIFLTAVLLSGISTLMYSSRQNDLENSRTMYGDWHYRLTADVNLDAGSDGSDFEGIYKELRSKVQRKEKGAGYQLEQCGRAQVKGMLTVPYKICFLYADESCRQMTHCQLTEGREPVKDNEIAADNYTLANLGFSGGIGDTLSLGGETYVLTGIVKSRWASGIDEMNLFVGEEFGKYNAAERNILYLKFDENEKLYVQLEAFRESYHIPDDAVEANEDLTMYLSGEKPDSIIDIIKFALTDERGNFTYIILKLQSEYNLAFNGMLALLLLFSLFVIYSVFNISVSRRKAEYAMLQTLGISEGTISGTLIFELWFLFFAGYPLGLITGNSILRLCGRKLNGIFTSKINETLCGESVQNAEDYAGFHVPWEIMAAGFVFLFFALALVGFLTVCTIRKQTLVQTMGGDTSFMKESRSAYSKRGCNLANIVTRKFMFSDKRKVLGIMLSLSIGGCIYLCTTYMTENLKVHAQMAFKSDDGLGSEYRVSVRSDSMADTIPSTVIEEMKDIAELAEVYASKYIMGELVIKKEQLEWSEYFCEQNKDSYYQERYGGICVDKGNGTYGIKYDVYGYDAGMVEELQEFLLEGEIDLKKLEKRNQIIAVANKDGQGNYNFYGPHPKDIVTLRVPKELNCPAEVLKFDADSTEYVEKQFEIAAIVSRALAKEDNYLNVNNWSNSQSFIMTNQQMEDNCGISGYSIVNASPVYGADTEEISGKILKTVRDVPKTVFRDYTTAIEIQKNYLKRQQLFFSGIAVILLVISLFHIMNSMNYSVFAHRREYGIIRAMGITDAGFYKMILRMGVLYGLLADVFIFLIYHLLFRRVMDYYMVHVVQFLHISAGIPAGIFGMIMVLNVAIAALAVMISAGKIAAGDIINEIRR